MSDRQILRVLSHNRPRRHEFRHPDTLVEGFILHARLRAAGYTMLSSYRGRTLLALTRQVYTEGPPGALVDCGTRNGGSAVLMAVGAPDRQLWAFDSFRGLPTPTAADGEARREFGGRLVGSSAMVREGFRRFASTERLNIVEGWFSDTLIPTADRVGPVACLHIDADLYDSVRLALEAFYPRVIAGGVVVVDDYVSWSGARLATDEFRAANGIEGRLIADHYWRKA